MTDGSWERPGSQVFRWTFTASLALALYWATAMLPNGLPESAPPWLSTLAVVGGAVGVAELSLRGVRRKHPHFLEPPKGLGAGEALVSIAIWSVPAYLLFVIVVGISAYLLVPRHEHHWPMVVYGLAVWGSLWLCVPPATVLAWWRSSR